jgi:hypothetical protein
MKTIGSRSVPQHVHGATVGALAASASGATPALPPSGRRIIDVLVMAADRRELVCLEGGKGFILGRRVPRVVAWVVAWAVFVRRGSAPAKTARMFWRGAHTGNWMAEA